MKKNQFKKTLLRLTLCATTQISWASSPESPPHDIYMYIEPESNTFFNTKLFTLFICMVVFSALVIWVRRQKHKKQTEQRASRIPCVQERLEALNPDWRPENNSTPYKDYCHNLDSLLREKIELLSKHKTAALTHTELVHPLTKTLNNIELEKMLLHLSELNRIQFLPPDSKFQKSRHELYQATLELTNTLEKKNQDIHDSQAGRV